MWTKGQHVPWGKVTAGIMSKSTENGNQSLRESQLIAFSVGKERKREKGQDCVTMCSATAMWQVLR